MCVCPGGGGAGVDRLTTQCLRGDSAFQGLPQGLTKVARRVDTERRLAAAMHVARVVSGVAGRSSKSKVQSSKFKVQSPKEKETKERLSRIVDWLLARFVATVANVASSDNSKGGCRLGSHHPSRRGVEPV